MPRRSNNNIVYTHVRPEQPTKNNQDRTYAGIWNEKKGVMQIGSSKCSLNDQFCKATGRRLALSRAGEDPEMTFSAEDAATARQQFFTYCGREREEVSLNV